MSEREDRTQAGFTLIEVLVALAILGVALPVLLAAFGDTLRRTREDEAHMTAASYAQSLLAAAGTEKPLEIGETSGDFGPGYRWRLSVTPYEELGRAGAWSVNAYLVTATVSWNNTHSLALKTLRFAPKERAP
jgi:prepilin-type N-terminal cleavage/methylation domain-containing protein